jgi:hypothetical protein
VFFVDALNEQDHIPPRRGDPCRGHTEDEHMITRAYAHGRALKRRRCVMRATLLIARECIKGQSPVFVGFAWDPRTSINLRKTRNTEEKSQ